MPVLSATGLNIVEGNSSYQDVTFTLTLDQTATAPVTLDWYFQDITAESGSDFASNSGSVTFSAGQSSRTITVRIFGDTAIEPDEWFNVVMTNIQGGTFVGGAAALVGAGRIYNNDNGSPGGSSGPGAAAVGVFGPASASPNLPTLTVHDASLFEGDSSYDFLRFLVTLDEAPTTPVSLAWYLQDQTATTDSDFSSNHGTLNLSAGQQSGWITVQVFGDTAIEQNETFNLILTDISGAVFGGAAAALSATGTIINDDSGAPNMQAGIGAAAGQISGPVSASVSVPTLAVHNASLFEGNSSYDYVRFLVTLDEAPTTPVSVNWYLQDGTAAAGSDFDSTTGTLNFDAGQQSGWITVQVYGDAVIEQNETFDLVLTNIDGAVFAGAGSAMTATGTIVNDDSGAPNMVAGVGAQGVPFYGAASASMTLPTLTVQDASLFEGASSYDFVRFLVTLDEAPTAPVTVRWYTQDGSASSRGGDYAEDTGTVTFAAGQTSAYVTVQVYGDTNIEQNETFDLVFTTVQGATFADNAAALIATGTIINDDSGAPTLSAGIGDNADPYFAARSDSDTLPTISIANTSVIEGNSSYGFVEFLVMLDRIPTTPVSFQFYTQDGSASGRGGDYAIDAGTVNFAAGQQSTYVSVAYDGDTLIEGDQTFHLVAYNAQGAVFDDDAPAVIATATIIDDDGGSVSGPAGVGIFGQNVVRPVSASSTLPTISVHSMAQFEGNSSTAPARFLITLDRPSTTPITIGYSFQDGTASGGLSEFNESYGSFTIPAGQQSYVLSTTMGSDTVIENNETFVLTLSSVTNAVFAGGAPALAATATIIEDDAGAPNMIGGVGPQGQQVAAPASIGGQPTIRLVPVSVNEGNSGTTNPAVYLILSHASTTAITMNVVSQPGTAQSTSPFDFAAVSNTFTIPAGVTSSAILPFTYGDTLNEGDETFTLQFSNLSNAVFEGGGVTQSVTITIRDDDGSGTASAVTAGPAFIFTAPTYGPDAIAGTNGPDTLYGLPGDDTINGLGGDDLLVGGPGMDVFNGGSGQDRVSYVDSTAGVTAFLGAPQLNSGDAAGDTYNSIEYLSGSHYSDLLGGDDNGNWIIGLNGNDTIYGAGGNDFLFGGEGNDTLEGQGGADYFDGEGGSNTVSYSTSTGGVIAFLVSNFANAGDAVGDIYFSIQNLMGTNHADILGGTQSENVIYGLDGDDWLFGNPGDDVLIGGNGNDLLHGEAGADQLDGQGGDDVASYRYASAGVVASLLSGGLGGEALGDTYVNVENIWASDFNDNIAGDNGNNQVYGFAGADIMAGNGGDDDFYGAEGGDTISGGSGADDFYFLTADQGGDVITDYNAGEGDRLLFSQYWFGIILGGFQTLPTANFVSNNAPAANAAMPQFLWDANDRVLYFDADGTGAGAAVVMASFTNGVTLTASDIWMA